MCRSVATTGGLLVLLAQLRVVRYRFLAGAASPEVTSLS
jgi:hypothetical protein